MPASTWCLCAFQTKRYQHGGSNHFLTISCYRRLAWLNSVEAKQMFERTLEDARRRY